MELKKTLYKLQTGQKLKIVALGDSLSYGWMVEKGYLAFLKEKLMVKYPRSLVSISNRGLPGDTARGGLHRLQEHVLDARPDLVLVQFALNDAFSGYSIEEFQSNILGIIDGIKSSTSAEILLMTSSALEGSDQAIAEQYYDSLKQIAAKKSVPIACVHEYWQEKIRGGVPFDSLVQYDRVHPTVDGYRLMAEAVMQLL